MSHNQNIITPLNGALVASHPFFGVFNYSEMQNEIWKDISELDDEYQISNFGRVKRKARIVRAYYGPRIIKERICNLQDNGHGYKQIYVQINRVRKLFYIHRLVAKYFIENPNSLPEVNHKDFNKANNSFMNLEWITIKGNRKHAFDGGRIPKGETHISSKLTQTRVIAIRRLFKINPDFNKSQIAKKLGVRDTTIHKIIRSERWAHL